MRFATKAIRVGQKPDSKTGAVIVPIYQTANFAFDEVGKHRGWEYTRTGNPTRGALETCLASLEEAQYCKTFSSGAAATDAVLSWLKSGDEVLCHVNLYGGTHRLLDEMYVPRGIKVTYIDARDPKKVQEALTDKTRIIWLETPTNPLMQIVDIPAMVELANRNNAMVLVDNTFASPYLQQPLTQGAHIVLHSMTKYIAGHSDVLGGAVMTNNQELDEYMLYIQNTIGAVLAPMDCWLTLRGVKTLALRMRQHCSNAMAVAKFLESHPVVEQVYYPGLPSHPQHELAAKQMVDFGGMLTFDLSSDIEDPRAAINTMIQRVECFWFAESLGGVESLICHPTTMSHAIMTPEQREEVGIHERTVRLSVGVEDIRDILEDLGKALDAVKAKHLHQATHSA